MKMKARTLIFLLAMGLFATSLLANTEKRKKNFERLVTMFEEGQKISSVSGLIGIEERLELEGTCLSTYFKPINRNIVIRHRKEVCKSYGELFGDDKECSPSGIIFETRLDGVSSYRVISYGNKSYVIQRRSWNIWKVGERHPYYDTYCYYPIPD